MASSSVELEFGMKMMAVLVGLVAGAKGLIVVVVVVVEDPSLAAKGRVTVEEAGVLVPEARIRTSTRVVGTSVAMVTPILFFAIGLATPETLASV